MFSVFKRVSCFSPLAASLSLFCFLHISLLLSCLNYSRISMPRNVVVLKNLKMCWIIGHSQKTRSWVKIEKSEEKKRRKKIILPRQVNPIHSLMPRRDESTQRAREKTNKRKKNSVEERRRGEKKIVLKSRIKSCCCCALPGQVFDCSWLVTVFEEKIIDHKHATTASQQQQRVQIPIPVDIYRAM